MIPNNGLTGKIICIHEGKGSVHDYELYKQSGICMVDFTLFVGDKGFQGIATNNVNTCSVFP